MPSPLLAVGHDIEAGRFLVLDCETHCIILSFAKALGGYDPRSKELDRWIGEP
jgi:hypothetical protein